MRPASRGATSIGGRRACTASTSGSVAGGSTHGGGPVASEAAGGTDAPPEPEPEGTPVRATSGPASGPGVVHAAASCSAVTAAIAAGHLCMRPR
jgi:hypothetical protein